MKTLKLYSFFVTLAVLFTSYMIVMITIIMIMHK